MLSECFPPRLRLPLCLQEDQRRPNPGIRGWMHAEGRAQLCAVGAQCCRGRLPEQQIPAELDVLVWFFFPPAAQDPIAKHKAMVGNGTIAESWDRSTGPILGHPGRHLLHGASPSHSCGMSQHAMQGMRSKASPTHREFSAWKVAGGSLAPRVATAKPGTAVKNISSSHFTFHCSPEDL